MRRQPGFTLTELLIAVTILGSIATFTIPKILTAQQNAQKLSASKEAAATVAQAWVLYKLQNSPGDTDLRVLEPYLNYVAKYTTGAQRYGSERGRHGL